MALAVGLNFESIEHVDDRRQVETAYHSLAGNHRDRLLLGIEAHVGRGYFIGADGDTLKFVVTRIVRERSQVERRQFDLRALKEDPGGDVAHRPRDGAHGICALSGEVGGQSKRDQQDQRDKGRGLFHGDWGHGGRWQLGFRK